MVSQNLKSSLYSLGCGEAEPWVCLSFLAVTGVDPKRQEMLECLALSDWLLELTIEQSSQSLNTGDLLELGWVGELPGCLSALNQDRRAETEPVAVTAADESTLLSLSGVWPVPDLLPVFVTSLCITAVLCLVSSQTGGRETQRNPGLIVHGQTMDLKLSVTQRNFVLYLESRNQKRAILGH